ncbi:beta-L-arabinofuranosidase domain-containing protein [Rudanella lutea]|uniref:beta-L-arabinofuranosidase domain-containing protein n=1 Tax=Rudanella lutea TaxID=451374 RepID=UPI000369A08B|nr:beta-L-arabinofuranosidase domain-containing protein [Rudanella lutea]
MQLRLFQTFSLSVLVSMAALAQTTPVANRAPLAPTPYTELPLGSIRPMGWLRTQLETMNQGSTGHLDEYYPKIKNDNGWLGGKGDGWEETPYWLDGAVPLAYLLDDPTLKAKVLKYINWTLDNQRPSGYFGPTTKYELETGKPVVSGEQGDDWWPKMIMLKVLQQYYSATADPRVIPFMTRYFRYQHEHLAKNPLVKWTEWAQARGGDNLMLVYWLYNRTGDKFLLDLGEQLRTQTTPWTRYFGERNWVMQAAAQQNGQQWMDRHAVNVGMGLKLPVIEYHGKRDAKQLEAFKTGWSDLMLLHGLPHGMFSGDEDLHGNDPVQGVELCAIVEAMFSLEQAIAIAGDVTYMDALERMTYNALPTQTTDDYNSRQYYQTANQVEVARGVYNFSLPFTRGMNHVFGPYAGYTCCTANMHQGWTKFAAHLWYGTNGGLAAVEYAPSVLKTAVAGAPVTITQETAYPFGETVAFTIDMAKQAAFPLEFRVPGWCTEGTLTLNGQPLSRGKGGTMLRVQRSWKPGDRLMLTLPMRVTTSNWAKNSRAVERGPLVYALKIPADWTQKELKEEGTYYEIKPKADARWNVGLSLNVVKDPVANTTVTVRNAAPTGFVWNEANAPIEIRAKGREIPGWKLVNGVAHQPISTREGFYRGEVNPQEEEITLIPYGCTKLRVVAFPVVR